MSIYSEYLNRITTTYRSASNGFHPQDAANKIYGALAGFDRPLNSVADAIEAQKQGRFSDRSTYERLWTDAFGLASLQFDDLKACVNGAALADRQKCASTIVDQNVAVRNANAQQATDQQLLEAVAKLLTNVRNDAIAAGEIRRDGGGTQLGPIDLEALKRSIAERASEKEDDIYASQLAIIGGQRSRV